jgi:hypothetical protein
MQKKVHGNLKVADIPGIIILHIDWIKTKIKKEASKIVIGIA